MELATHIAKLKEVSNKAIKNFDTIYLGDPTCRKLPGNISEGNDLEEAVDKVKTAGKNCYLALYSVPRNKDIEDIKNIIDRAEKLPIDGFEINNMGLLNLIKSKKIHTGVFINLYTSQTAKLFVKNNVSRILPNPELSINEIDIIKKVVDITFPINGNIPLGISDRCFFLDELKLEGNCETLCAKPHWLNQDNWQLGEIGMAPISGKELCMAEYFVELIKKGYQYFYIYSLRRDEFYLESVSSIYRELNSGKIDPVYAVKKLDELAEFGLCNGYFFGQSGYKYITKDATNKEAT